MQINEVGNSHSDTHNVTTCIHTQTHSLEGKAGAAWESASATPQSAETVTQPQGTFSLSAWLKSTLNAAKTFAQNLWGGGVQETLEEGSKEAYPEKTVLQEPVLEETQDDSGKLHGPQVAAGALGVQTPQSLLQQNPYFSPAEAVGSGQATLAQKVKIRFQKVSKYLTGQFSGKKEFQAKQERPREDLRRHSRYRQDDLEIDCVLTDDSYLLDSYDRKGEYRKLSAKE